MAGTILKRFYETTGRLGRFALEGANHLLWPAVCDCCGCPVSADDKRLCRDCWNELLECTAGEYCPSCGKDVSKYGIINGRCAQCESLKLSFDGIARAGVYDGVLRDMILAFKFHDRTELGGILCELANSAFMGSTFRQDTDMIVPVPLHWRRRFGRGFNQAQLISKGLAHGSADVDTDLVRIRYTERQWSLSPAKRKRNVKGAFTVRKGHNYSGKSACLVDDITTSYATLNECARTLKEAGAKNVFACVVAVAMQEKD
jgi:ComF family protein